MKCTEAVSLAVLVALFATSTHGLFGAGKFIESREIIYLIDDEIY